MVCSTSHTKFIVRSREYYYIGCIEPSIVYSIEPSIGHSIEPAIVYIL